MTVNKPGKYIIFRFYLIKMIVESFKKMLFLLFLFESYFNKNILVSLKSFSILCPASSSSNFVQIEHSPFICTIIYYCSNEQIAIITEET